MGYILPQSKMLISWLITLHQAVTKLFIHLFFMFSRSRNPFFAVSQSYLVRKIRKSRSTSSFTGARGYWWLGLMDFCDFFIPYVFEVKESIFRSFTKLPCSENFENRGQLPVSQVLEGTDDWVLWIFVISSFPTFSRSRNPFFAVSQSYHVWKTSKIEVNFRFHRCSRVLMIGSYGFLWFLHSLRFRGQGIHFSQFHKATMFGKLRKSRSTSGFTGARGYWWLGLMDFRDFFIPYVFKVEESIFRSFTNLPCSENFENRGQLPVSRCSRVLMIGSYGFSWFLYSVRFRGQRIHFSQFHKATMLGKLRKSRSTSGFTGAQGYWWLGLIDFCDFFIPYVFEVEESIFRFFTEQPCLSDLDNPCQLQVLQLFDGTGDYVPAKPEVDLDLSHYWFICLRIFGPRNSKK